MCKCDPNAHTDPPPARPIGRLICPSRGSEAGLRRMLGEVGGQLRWKPFSMVAASRRSLMMSSEEYSGSFR